MSTRINLQRALQLDLLPVHWKEGRFYTMKNRGTWPWVVSSCGAGGRLAIDIDGLEKFMKEVAPAWAYSFRNNKTVQKLREAAES